MKESRTLKDVLLMSDLVAMHLPIDHTLRGPSQLPAKIILRVRIFARCFRFQV